MKNKNTGLMSRDHRSGAMGILLLVFLVVTGSLHVEGFFSINNINSMLLLAAFLGLASLGQTFCALLGALDMSIPFLIGGANIGLAALFSLNVAPTIAIPIVLLCALALGALNGLLSFRLQGQALILTHRFIHISPHRRRAV